MQVEHRERKGAERIDTHIKPLKILVCDVHKLLGPFCALGEVIVLGSIRLGKGEERDGLCGEREQPGDVLVKTKSVECLHPSALRVYVPFRPLPRRIFALPSY